MPERVEILAERRALAIKGPAFLAMREAGYDFAKVTTSGVVVMRHQDDADLLPGLVLHLTALGFEVRVLEPAPRGGGS